MAEEQNYYKILGITPDASSEEIARAHARKRREYANNEEMTLLITRAYEELRNPQNREYNDIDAKYGQRINELEEALSKTESQEEYIKVISKLKKIYLELISEYSTYRFALIRMFRFERILGNDSEAEKYLLRLEQLINSCESEKEKLDLISFLGDGYKELGKTESAIKMYKQIYEADADRVGEIISLCRLLCEGPKNSKAAIQILNLCTNKAKKVESKASYLCETIRIVDSYGEQSYDKVRQTLTKLLKGLTSKAEQPGLVAKSVFSAMEEALNEKKISLFKLLHEVFISYNVEVPEIKYAVVAMSQMAEIIEDGKLHEFVEIYLTKGWTDTDRTKMSRLLLKDIDAIQVCINCIKNNAPTYWDEEEEKLKDLQEFITEVYSQVKEYQRIKSNTNISRELREMIRILIVDGLVRFETMQTEFESDRDKFFGRQNKTTLQNELYILERNYPACYKLFSDLFFEGKSTQELFGAMRQTQEVISNNNKTNNEKDSDFVGGICLLLGIAGGVFFFTNPLVGGFAIWGAYAAYKKWAGKKDNGEIEETQEEIKTEVRIRPEKELEYKKEYASICLDKVMNEHLKRMISLLQENPYEAIKQEFEEEKDAFFEEMSMEKIKKSLERLEVYYPLTYEKISALLFNTKRIPNITPDKSNQEKKPGCLRKVLKWMGIIFLFLLIGEILESMGMFG